MNNYGLRLPASGFTVVRSRVEEAWRVFRATRATLRMSEGSQAVIRNRRHMLVDPPVYTDRAEKEARRLRNRARRVRQGRLTE